MTNEGELGPLNIVAILPELLGSNGDAANARVLAQRAGWAGLPAEVVPVRSVADLPEQVDAVVIGSGTDAQLIPVREILLGMADKLRDWATAGIPILAVGTGLELLSWGIELPDGSVVEGLGLVAGRAVPRTGRAAGDLVVTSKHGRLIGFENHARSFVGAEASSLGTVVSGVGNGAGAEGVVMGNVVGTHLHGPVLAKNPGLADHLLRAIFATRGVEYAQTERAAEVDGIAKAARNQIAVRLGLATE